jgi:dihydroflavonol-4-reductase
MRLLLTGATGFIGSRLALAARERNFDIALTGQANSVTERSRAAALESAGLSLARGSLQDPAFARSLVQGCDAVIHLAAAQHEANVSDTYFEEINVGGTRTLLEASRDAGVKRFVYGSTIGVYGSATQGDLDESSPTRPENIYGRTKLRAEELVREFGFALETVVIRISETYGPGDLRLLKLFAAIDRGTFFIIGPGLNRRQVIHVDDLNRGLLLAVEQPAAPGQTFLLAGHEVMTTRDFVREIATALGREPPRWHAPLWPFAAAAVVLEATLKPIGIQPPLHRRRLDFFRKSFVFSVAKARSILGFEPQICFSDGAKETAAWYRAQGLLKH